MKSRAVQLKTYCVLATIDSALLSALLELDLALRHRSTTELVLPSQIVNVVVHRLLDDFAVFEATGEWCSFKDPFIFTFLKDVDEGVDDERSSSKVPAASNPFASKAYTEEVHGERLDFPLVEVLEILFSQRREPGDQL